MTPIEAIYGQAKDPTCAKCGQPVGETNFSLLKDEKGETWWHAGCMDDEQRKAASEPPP
jgi:hypothetical protein